MESYPARKARKARKALEADYPLEWEDLALKEAIQKFKVAKNEKIDLEGQYLPDLPFRSEEEAALYRAVFHQLIFCEPYLYKMYAYTTLEALETRQTFFERYLAQAPFMACQDILDDDVLIDSELAKSHKLSGIPLHSCFVGKVLQNLFDKTESLRKNDNDDPEEIRITRTAKTLTFEFFKKADYESPLVDQQIDENLCAMFHKGKQDRRKDLFFGGSLDHWEFEVIKRFGNEKPIVIPFHLLPKYRNLIRKLARKAPSEDRKELEDKITMKLWEIISDRTPGKDELSLSASIKKQIKWRFGAEQKKGYIQQKGKRISKESIDHAGSIDDPTVAKDDEEAGRRGDITEDDKTLDPEADLIESERYSRVQEYIGSMADKHIERLRRILDQDEKRSMADQKFYNRITKEIRQKVQTA